MSGLQGVQSLSCPSASRKWDDRACTQGPAGFRDRRVGKAACTVDSGSGLLQEERITSLLCCEAVVPPGAVGAHNSWPFVPAVAASILAALEGGRLLCKAVCLQGVCRLLPPCIWQPFAFNSSSLSRLG